MSDQYGIGTAMQMAAHLYSHTARRTGRTSKMIDGLRSGDVVVFKDQKEANRVEALCRDRNLRIKCVVASCRFPPENLSHMCPANNRVVVDHGWLEEYYSRVLTDADAHFTAWDETMNRLRTKPKPIDFKPWTGVM